jgi:hypothetical protein
MLSTGVRRGRWDRNPGIRRNGRQGAGRAGHGGSLWRPVRFTDLLAQRDIPRPRSTGFLQTLTIRACWAMTKTGHLQPWASGWCGWRMQPGRTSSLAPIARPYLDELAAETGETIHLAQMDQGQVLYVDKRNAAKPVEMFSSAGKVGPAYCTGVGKAMLAYLDDAALGGRPVAPKLSPLHRRNAGHPRQAEGRTCRRFAPAAMPLTAKNTSRESSAARCRFSVGQAGCWGRFRSPRPPRAPPCRAEAQARRSRISRRRSREAESWRFPEQG